VDFDDYVQWDAVNASKLKHFYRRTDKHALHEINTGGKRSTPALDLGWLVHLAVLEPERYASSTAQAPKADRRTKVGKAIFAEFEASHPDAIVVASDTFAKVRRMADAVMEHESAALFFNGKGSSEVSVIWDDEKIGVRCKCRIDHVNAINGWPIVGDLKTARNASRQEFGKSMEKFVYDLQAAHYLTGLEAIVPIPAGSPYRRFVFFVVESEEPHCVACHEIEDGSLDEGKRKRERLLKRWRHAVETGVWSGYSPGIELVGLPSYGFYSEED
jgi:hypothetical protein